MTEVLMIRDKPETIFDARDFQYHIEKHMGYEAADYFRKLFEDAEAEIESAKRGENTDLASYKASLDSNRTAFNDIQEVVFSILKYCHSISNYPIKYKAVLPIMEKLKEIKTIINNQI